MDGEWHGAAQGGVGGGPRGTRNRLPRVRILGRPRPALGVRRALEGAARAASERLGLPLEDGWVHWQELPDGTVFAGGQHL